MSTSRPIVDLVGQAPPPEWGVTVDLDAIAVLADAWAGQPFELPDFDYPGTPDGRAEQWWFDYVTLAVSVLACLWPPHSDEMWSCEHDGQWLDDAPGIFAAFTRSVDADIGIDLAQFASMSDADARAFFAGRGTLQFIDQRVETMRRVATTIRERWDGTARNLVEDAARDGTRIKELLCTTMPGYLDRPETSAGIAHFDKLAHLSAAIMAAGVGWDRAGFSGYEDFPVYPDYMLPRVFRHYGAMVYTADVAGTVDTQGLIAAESDAEHAIRWATIYCGAQLRAALLERGTRVTGPALDYRLWSEAVLGPEAASFGEHHRTLTLRY